MEFRATPAGRSFLRMSRSILEQVDALVTTTRANGRGEAGRLAIGFCTSLTAGNLRASLIEFKQRFSQIELATVERSRTRLVAGLRSSVLDVLIVAGDLPILDCKSMQLWSERILVVLQRDHPLAMRDAMYWTDLRDQTVLLSQYDPGRELEELLNSKLTHPGDNTTTRTSRRKSGCDQKLDHHGARDQSRFGIRYRSQFCRFDVSGVA